MFLIALLLAGQQAAAQPAPAPQADVVITGTRMRDALAKCLARNCPPEEEVDAAMNAGAESFARGKYREAKRILQRAISRNQKYAARMPGRLSDLYSTYADVAEHEGDKRAFIRTTRKSVTILQEQLGETHPTAIGVSPRLGDMWMKLGQPGFADAAYRAAAASALQAGNGDIAGVLTFRRASLALAKNDRPAAQRLADQLERSHGNDPRFAPLILVLRARIGIGDGRSEGTDALIAALRSAGVAEPVLLSAPPYPIFDAGFGSGMMPGGDFKIEMAEANTRLSSSDILWADIGFWVRPDGKTADMQILRPARDGEWAEPLLKQVAGRRYALANPGPGGIGAYRVERFTLRGTYGQVIGSRIQERTGPLTLHRVDLTRLSEGEQVAAKP